VILKLVLKFKVWLEVDGKPIIGEGGAQLLRAIDKYGSLAKACQELGLSYKFAWLYLQRAEKALGKPIVVRRRGGAKGGGMDLTEAGRNILDLYERAVRKVEEALKELEKEVDKS